MGDRRRTTVGAVVAVTALVAAVLLTRGGTAATEDDLALPQPTAPSESAAPSPRPSPSPTPTVGVMDIGLDGTAGARLGPRPQDRGDGSGWSDTGLGSTDGRCSLLVFQGARTDLLVTGWQVGDRIVSVAMRSQAQFPPSDVPSAWGTGFGDDLDAIDYRAPAVLKEEPLEDAVQESVRSVSVVRGGIEVVFSDVGSESGIRYIEVREPDGAQCRSDRWLYDDLSPAAAVDLDDLPVLDAAGRGPVRFGQPEAELSALGIEALFPGQDAEGCQDWVPLSAAPGTAGLDQVLSKDGVVVSIRFRRGRTAEGLATGDPFESVASVYPDLVTTGGDDPASDLGDGRLLRVGPAVETIMPSTVDEPVASTVQVVGMVEVSTARCGG